VVYISALIGDHQYSLAQETIDRGKKTLKDQEITQDMVYMQATLYDAQNNTDKALVTAEAAIKTIKKANEEAKANYKKTGKPTTAMMLEENANYWDLLLLKASILEKKQDWKQALGVYDEYLAEKATAATVFVDRGDVKAKLGDKKGAEADYRQALVFIPDNADALAGLKQIGVAK
jgi:tetratricopeptide (TPR) repeat protein